MFVVIKAKRIITALCALFLLAAEVTALYYLTPRGAAVSTITESLTEGEIVFLLENISGIRNKALLEGDTETVKKLYNTNKRNGLYAYDHEVKKIKYIANWSEKQGVKFISADSTVVIKWDRMNGDGTCTVNFLMSTEYRYVYNDAPREINDMRIGTYHEIDLMTNEGGWLITREWYTDPFADSLGLEKLKTDEVLDIIMSHGPREFTDMNEGRKSAVAYADKYVGAADSGENGYGYNNEFKNYNNVGGDCANFVSQVLLAGGFKKSGSWNYQKDGSRAWLKSAYLKDFLLYSGRGSLITSGTYSKVLPLSYELLPGDIVAYYKKGKITHVSVVTGADSKGCALVNCHNTDRYRVPWDLGWSNSGIKFYFIRVNY